MWIGINVLITFVGRGNISWQGHLGGFVGGLLITVVLVYAPRAAPYDLAGRSACPRSPSRSSSAGSSLRTLAAHLSRQST